MNFKSRAWIVTSEDGSIIHRHCGHSMIHGCWKDVTISEYLNIYMFTYQLWPGPKSLKFPYLGNVLKAGLLMENYFSIAWRVRKVPTIYRTVSNLTGSALNNYEKNISGLLRISKAYVTNKKCILIISLVVMPES